MDINSKYFHFVCKLQGFDYYLNGKWIEKCALFWAGYDADKILANKTNVKLKERK